MNTWYVLTGAPSSGKTTIVRALEDAGHMVVHESARLYIDECLAKGQTIEEIRVDENRFQEAILDMKIMVEEALDQGKIIFFDRGIPDTTAYLRLGGVEPVGDIKNKLSGCSYKKVFLLEPLPYVRDYARVETDEERTRLHDLLGSAYKELDLEVISVPVLPLQDRVNFILSNL